MPSDFTLMPDFVFDETPSFQTIVSQFESGHEQRRAKWATPLRKWHLEYKNRSVDDKDTMMNFFLSKLGKATAFTWTNPNDDVEYSVRFDSDDFKISRKAFGIYDFSVELVQVK